MTQKLNIEMSEEQREVLRDMTMRAKSAFETICAALDAANERADRADELLQDLLTLGCVDVPSLRVRIERHLEGRR